MRQVTLAPFLVLSVVCASTGTIQRQTVGNPVGKVVDLLEKLKKQLSKEGTEEAEAYDKFACFCKEQADAKLYAITKSKKKIELLESQIKELEAQIEEHDKAVEEGKKKKKEMEEEGKKAAEKRKEAREEYEDEEKDLATALQAIKDAIAALKESKAKMALSVHHAAVSHKTPAAVISHPPSPAAPAPAPALAPAPAPAPSTTTSTTTTGTASNKTVSREVTDSAMESDKQKESELVAARRQINELKAQLAKAQEKAYSKAETSASSAVKKVMALLSGDTKVKKAIALLSTAEDPAPYKYGSDDIIETLQTLFKQFRDNKYTLDNDEMKEKQEYEMEKGARDMQIKFTTELIEKNTELSAEKSKKKSDAESDRDDEEDMKEKDNKFMEDLTEKCEEKAEAWDERSKARSGEITAITKALELLKSGVQPNYSMLSTKESMDKKMEDVLHKDQDEEVDEILDDDNVGFLQLRSSVKRQNGVKKREARKAILKFLVDRSADLKSTSLALIVEQIRFGADHFAKIRELIKDLIQEIKDTMEAEKKKKKQCDEDLGKATDKRDEMLAKEEEVTNDIQGSKARLVKLDEDVTEAELQIAELYKALNEATEIRDEEKADNEKGLAEAKEGLEAVTQAIKVLEDYYSGGFLQTDAKAPGGRDGKSVDDLAPEAETGEYKGSDAGKDIIGLLEVIQGDFEKTVKETEKAEEESESGYDETKDEIETDIKSLKKDSKDKKDELETEESDLVDHKEALKDAKESLADAKDELDKLRPMCVDLGLTFEGRQARSKEEIKALKEALKILKEYSK